MAACILILELAERISASTEKSGFSCNSRAYNRVRVIMAELILEGGILLHAISRPIEYADTLPVIL